MNNFIKRFISSLLIVITIISLMPLETLNTYAAGGIYDGDGTGDKIVSGKGDFDVQSSGYRFWLMGSDGLRVPGTKIVDIINREVTNSKEVRATFNTKVEPWTGTTPNAGEVVQALFSEVNSIPNLTGPIPRPIDAHGSQVVGKGEDFREWLTKGKVAIQSSPGSGGGGWTQYTGTGGKKPSTDTGGDGSKDNPLTQDQVKTINMYMDMLQKNTEYKANSLNNSKSKYTRVEARLALKQRIQSLYDSYYIILTDKNLPTAMLTAKYKMLYDASYSMLDETGWKIGQHISPGSGAVTDATHIISDLFDTAYAINEVNLENSITEEPDGTIFIDFAYATETPGTGEEVVEDFGNLPTLLDAKLADWLNALNNPNIEQRDRITSSFGASGIKLIIEPIVWFHPSTLAQIDGKWQPGTSPNWRFYGTPTTYASMMEYNKANGKWHDGNGKGGYNHNPMNAVTSVCMFISGNLSIASDEEYIRGITPPAGNKEVMNSELQNTKLGYSMHYVRFGDDGPGLSAPVIKCKKTPRKKCSFMAERREKR